MSRFRPNLVLAGAPAGAEDRCRAVELGGGASLALVKLRPLRRDHDRPGDGRKTGKEPLRTLARIRRNARTGGAWFGQNAVPVLNGCRRRRCGSATLARSATAEGSWRCVGASRAGP